MDLSSLPEAERQQLQQLQEMFKQHQQQKLIQQQQQQQEEEEQQKQREIQRQYQEQYQCYAYQYDPSQCPWQTSYVDSTQSFDYSSQAYYQHYYQQEHDSRWQQQQQGHVRGAHLQDYANSAHHQYQQPAEVPPGLRHVVEAEPQLFGRAPVHQPVCLIGASGRSGVVADGEQQNFHYLEQGVVEAQSAGTAAYPRLSPAAAAAVAALSQLTEFAGKMGVADRALAGPQQGRQLQAEAGGGHEQIMSHSGTMSAPRGTLANQPSHSGGGRKGIKPIRSGNGGVLRGRNVGSGGGSDRGQSGSGHGHSAKNASSSSKDAKSSAIVPGEAAQDKVRRAPQVLQCEICKIGCNSAEILEQHKNGKKHKKNLEKIEELRKANYPFGETKNGETSASSCNVEVASLPEILHQGGKSQAMPENLTIKEATGGSSCKALGQTDAAVQPPSTAEDAAKKNKRKGMKRKQTNGHEPKRTKVEPRVTKVVAPLVCDVCNIKCDTQEVLDCHLAGKKHIAKVNRLRGNQGMVGTVGLQALYPPNPVPELVASSTSSPPV